LDDVDKNVIEGFAKELPSNARLILIQKCEGGCDIGGAMAFPSPAFLEVGEKVKMLLCSGEQFSFYKESWKNRKPEEVMLNLLKKRHLDPLFRNEKIFQDNIFVIDAVPDIFVAGNFGSSGMMNYKGTTMISCGDFSSERVYWIVNLRTRECIKTNSA
jgi:DNA polymerase II small subunit/DNA polymerase delta subunit B